MKYLSALPSLSNIDYPFILMLEISTAQRPISGLASFVYRKRRIHVLLLKELMDVAQAVNFIGKRLGQRKISAKARIVVVDRLIDGRVMSGDLIKVGIVGNVINLYARRRNRDLPPEILELKVSVAEQTAKTLLLTLQKAFRPKPTLLKNTDPITVLESTNYNWKIPLTAQTLKYDVELLRIYETYISDEGVSGVFLRNMFRLPLLTREAFQTTLGDRKSQIVEEMQKRYPDSPDTVASETARLTEALDKAFIRFRATGARHLLYEVLHNRVNWLNRDILRVFILERTNEYLSLPVIEASADLYYVRLHNMPGHLQTFRAS